MSTTTGYVLAGSLFILAALVNWWAVQAPHRRAIVVAKPLALAALIAVALTGDAAMHPAGRWLLVGLVLSLAGDIFLLFDTDTAFLGGLGAFLLGHLAYGAAFITLGLQEPAWGLIGVTAMIAAALAIRTVIPAAHREGGAGLTAAVIAYALVIGVMVVTAWMTGEWLVGVGATTFMVSDSVLALNKFVRRRPYGDLAVMVTYHLGQVGIVLGVLSALAPR